MAITLVKKKPLQAEQEMFSPEVNELVELIDRVGQLQEEAEEIQKRIAAETERLKPYKDALKELQAKVDALEADPDLPLEQLGNVFRLEAGKVGASREICDMPKVREILGDALFMQLATVKLGDLDKYMTPPQLEQVLTIKPTRRSIKVIRRAV